MFKLFHMSQRWNAIILKDDLKRRSVSNTLRSELELKSLIESATRSELPGQNRYTYRITDPDKSHFFDRHLMKKLKAADLCVIWTRCKLYSKCGLDRRTTLPGEFVFVTSAGIQIYFDLVSVYIHYKQWPIDSLTYLILTLCHLNHQQLHYIVPIPQSSLTLTDYLYHS